MAKSYLDSMLLFSHVLVRLADIYSDCATCHCNFEKRFLNSPSSRSTIPRVISFCTFDQPIFKPIASLTIIRSDISQRIRLSWDSLPNHLRYWKTCWDEGVPSSVCLMLTIVHLTHWYNEFMIQKLLDYTPITSHLALLRVSVDLLSHVLALATVRDRTYDVHRDLLHCILLYGIPAASVLATALREQHHTGHPFPAEISRSEIVRMLSVLISHLDAAAHAENSGARQGEANYNLCRKASKIFTKVIDAVLDSHSRGSEVTPSSDNLGLDFNFEAFSGPGLDGFESLEFSGLGPLGLSGNMGNPNAGTVGDNIDWGAVGQWSL